MSDAEERFAALRARAEAALAAIEAPAVPRSPEDVKRLAQELATYQIELELQHDELRRAHREAEQARDRFRDLYEFAPVGYLTVGANGLILEANLAAATGLGLERGRLLGRRFSSVIRPEDQDAFYSHRKQVLQSQERCQLELRLCREGEGHPFFWALLESIAAPLPNQDRTMRVSFQDISDRKREQEQARRAEKLEAVGVLAGGIAHDFNNFLVSILTAVQLAQSKVAPTSDVAELLRSAELGCDRAAAVAKQLLTFSRGGAPIKKTESMGELLSECAPFTLRGSNVVCKIHLAPDLWLVNVDAGQMAQVVTNLIINADQAMPAGGVLAVSAANALIESGQEVSEGRYVRVSFADSGVGIPKDSLRRIFDPEFSTTDGGHGLGLATAHSIVVRHGGSIWATSVAGQGSTFEFLVPAAPSSAPPAATTTSNEEHTGSLLLMDDEKIIRVLAKRALTELGYEVEEAAAGEEAIRLYTERRASGRPFDVVLLDLTVPEGMGGAETLNELLKIDPEVRAIVVSGYSDDPIMADFGAYGFKGVLEKPFSIQGLSEAVAAVLKLPE